MARLTRFSMALISTLALAVPSFGADTVAALLKAEDRGERPPRRELQPILAGLVGRLRRVAAADWDLEPDSVEKLLRSRPKAADELDRDAFGAGGAKLASLLRALAKSRGGKLLAAAKAAAEQDDIVRKLSLTDRALAYGTLPDVGLLRDIFLYYRQTCRYDAAVSAATAVLRGGRYDNDSDTLRTVARSLKGEGLDAAVSAYLSAVKVAGGWRRDWSRRRIREELLLDALEDLAPDHGFIRLLGDGQAEGFLRVGRAFRGRGEMLAAASSFEKAALVTSERQEAFAELARVYRAVGDEDALRRTLKRARALGIEMPDAAETHPAGGRTKVLPGRVAWSIRRPTSHVYLDHVRTGGLLIEGVRERGFTSQNRAYLWGIDARTGRIVWRAGSEFNPMWLEPSGLHKGYTGHLALVCRNGQLVWDVYMGRMVVRTGGGSGRSYGAERYRVDPATGRKLRRKVAAHRYLKGTVHDRAGRTRVGIDGKHLTAIDVDSGARLWTRDLHPDKAYSHGTKSFLDLSGDVVAAGGSNGQVMLVRAADGGLIWSGRLPGRVSTRPLVAAARVYFGTIDGFVWALDRGSGEALWERRMPLWPVAFAAGEDGSGGVYVLSNDGDMYCLDAGDGRVVWERRLGGMSKTGHLALRGRRLYAFPGVGGDAELLTTADFFVHALDARTGESLWAVPLEDPAAGRATPMVEDDRIFLTSSSSILCIRTDRGAPGLEARVKKALGIAREFAGAGRLREAAFAASEAADRIDPGSFELMAEAARLSARARLGAFAARRIERWSGALLGTAVELNGEQTRLLTGQLSAEEKGDALCAAVVLARTGLWSEEIERAASRSSDARAVRRRGVRNAALRAWAAHAEPGTVEAKLKTRSLLAAVKLDNLRRANRRDVEPAGGQRRAFTPLAGAEEDVPGLLEVVKDPWGTRRIDALGQLVRLLGKDAGPVLLELDRANPRGVEDKQWCRAMFYGAISVDTSDVLPIVLRYGFEGKSTLGESLAPFVTRHATEADLRPWFRKAFEMTGASQKRAWALRDIRGVLGGALVGEAWRVLADPKSTTASRLGAVAALAETADARGLPVLLSVARAEETTSDLLRAAVYAMSRIPGPDAESTLRSLYETKGEDPASVHPRELAALCLAVRGDGAAALEAARFHSDSDGPAKRDAWLVFSACFARETFRRGGSSYEPRHAGRRPVREALKWVFYFRDLTKPEERLKPFSFFGRELGPKPPPEPPRLPDEKPAVQPPDWPPEEGEGDVF